MKVVTNKNYSRNYIAFNERNKLKKVFFIVKNLIKNECVYREREREEIIAH